MKFKFVLIAVAIVLAPAAWGQAVITLPGGYVSLGVAALGALGASGTAGLPPNSNVTPPYVGDAGNLAGE